MSKISLTKVECPNCGHSFYIKEFYQEKKVDETYISETLKKYKKYELHIEQMLNFISAIDKVEPNLANLQRILEFIHKTPGGLFKFMRAKEYYIDKRLYLNPDKGGLNYFLAICKNTILGDKADGLLPQKDDGGNKPAGKEI